MQIDKVTVFVIADDSAGMAMYESDELDTMNVPSADIDRVKADSVLSTQMTNVSQLVMYMIQFNVQHKPMDNPNLRKALAASINKEALAQYVGKLGQVSMDTVTPLGAFGAVPKSAHIGIPFNVAAAKEYLVQAGYPEGKGLEGLEFCFNTSEFNRAAAEGLQWQWKTNLGLDVALKNFEGKVYWDAIVGGGLQFWRMGANADTPDADAWLYAYHTKEGEKIIQWKRTDFDTIVEKARSESDLEVRKDLYLQAEKILVQDEAAIIPLWSYAYVNLTKPRLTRTYSTLMADTVKNWKISK